MTTKPPRHPDLLTTGEAAAYLGVDRLDKLPADFRPEPVPYHRSLYHRKTLDQIVEQAAKQAEGKSKLRIA